VAGGRLGIGRWITFETNLLGDPENALQLGSQTFARIAVAPSGGLSRRRTEQFQATALDRSEGRCSASRTLPGRSKAAGDQRHGTPLFVYFEYGRLGHGGGDQRFHIRQAAGRLPRPARWNSAVSWYWNAAALVEQSSRFHRWRPRASGAFRGDMALFDTTAAAA